LRLEGAPQVGHVGLKDAQRRSDGVTRPEILDQCVGGHGLAVSRQEAGEVGALPIATEIKRRAVPTNFYRAKNEKVHGRPFLSGPSLHDRLPTA
jgi:hypothetical protein